MRWVSFFTRYDWIVPAFFLVLSMWCSSFSSRGWGACPGEGVGGSVPACAIIYSWLRPSCSNLKIKTPTFISPSFLHLYFTGDPPFLLHPPHSCHVLFIWDSSNTDWEMINRFTFSFEKSSLSFQERAVSDQLPLQAWKDWGCSCAQNNGELAGVLCCDIQGSCLWIIYAY